MIFDFDGTLAHLTLDFGVMRQRAIDAAAAVLEEARIKNAVPALLLPTNDTRPMLEWLEMAQQNIAEHCTITAQHVVNAAHRAIEDVELEAAKKGELFPWTRPMLAALLETGVPSAIITRNCRKAVLTVFPDALEYCTCLLTREDVPYVKPHPDHLLRALFHTGSAAQHTLMVGDHPMDIETGKAGGTLTAGVSSGNTPHTLLAAAHPDFMAADCLELYDQLRATCLSPQAAYIARESL